MKQISLTIEERNLLYSCLERHSPNLIAEVKYLDSKRIAFPIIDEMRNAIVSEIAEKGFLKDDPKSYEYGKELERLADKLAEIYIWPYE